MGTVGDIPRGALVAGIFYRDHDVYTEALPELTAEYGPVLFESPEFLIDMTDYYEAEMGAGLRKRFLCFERPLVLDRFPAVKHFSNGIEERYAISGDDGMKRRINIDPGYVTLAKLVLASTKNYSHRIYIGDGIYAEITLKYFNGAFRPTETTYPDYSTALALEFFTSVREHVKRNRAQWT